MDKNDRNIPGMSMSIQLSPPRKPPPETKKRRKKPQVDPKTMMFESLLKDPVHKKMILDLINENKPLIEEYQLREKTIASPIDKIKKTTVTYESPTAQARRRALAQENQKRQKLNFKENDSSTDVSASPKMKQPKETLLKGVCAFVEVMTCNVNKSEGVKILMKSMGATISERLLKGVSHVIYKDGSYETYKKARALNIPVVSVLWLEVINRTGTRVPSKNYPPWGLPKSRSACDAFCDKLNNKRHSLTASSLANINSNSNRRETLMPSQTQIDDDFLLNLPDSNSDDIIPDSRPESPMKMVTTRRRTRRTDETVNEQVIDSDSYDNSDVQSDTPAINGSPCRLTRHELNVSKKLNDSLQVSPLAFINTTRKTTHRAHDLDMYEDSIGSSNEMDATNVQKLTTAIAVRGKNSESTPPRRMTRTSLAVTLQNSTSNNDKSINTNRTDGKVDNENQFSNTGNTRLSLRTRTKTPRQGSESLTNLQAQSIAEEATTSKVLQQTSHYDFDMETDDDNLICDKGNQLMTPGNRRTLSSANKTLRECKSLNDFQAQKATTSKVRNNQTEDMETDDDNYACDKEMNLKTPRNKQLPSTETRASCKNSLTVLDVQVTKMNDNMFMNDDKHLGTTKTRNQSSVNDSKTIKTPSNLGTTKTRNQSSVNDSKSIKTPSNKVTNSTNDKRINLNTTRTPTTRRMSTRLSLLKQQTELGKIGQETTQLSVVDMEITNRTEINSSQMFNNSSKIPIVEPTRKTTHSTLDMEITQENEDDNDSSNIFIDNVAKTPIAKRQTTVDDIDITKTRNNENITTSSSRSSTSANLTTFQPRRITRRMSMHINAQQTKISNDSAELSSLKVANSTESTNVLDLKKKISSGTELSLGIISSKEPSDSGSGYMSPLELSIHSNSNENEQASRFLLSSIQSEEEESNNVAMSNSSEDDQKENSSSRRSKRKPSAHESEVKNTDDSPNKKENVDSPGRKNVNSTEDDHKENSYSRRSKRTPFAHESEVNIDSSPNKKKNVDSSDASSGRKGSPVTKLMQKLESTSITPRRTTRKSLNQNKLLSQNDKITSNPTSGGWNTTDKSTLQTESSTIDSTQMTQTTRGKRKLYNPDDIIPEEVDEETDRRAHAREQQALLNSHKPYFLKSTQHLNNNTDRLNINSPLKNRNNMIAPSQRTQNDASSDSDDDDFIELTQCTARVQKIQHLTQTQQTQKSTQKAKTKVKRKYIVSTRFNAEQTLELQRIVDQLGDGTIENKVTSRTTHLIAIDCSMTMNMVRALCRGLWIVSRDWLLKSAKAGKWDYEDFYELTQFSPCVEQLRLQRQNMGKAFCHDVFLHCGPMYIAESSHPRKKDLEEFVTLCKGRVVEDATEAKILVGLSNNNVTESQVSVREAWILDCITVGRVKKTKSYLIYTNL